MSSGTIEQDQVDEEIARAVKELVELHQAGKLVSLAYIAVTAETLPPQPGDPAMLKSRGATRMECSNMVGQAMLEMSREAFLGKNNELRFSALAEALKRVFGLTLVVVRPDPPPVDVVH